MNRISCILGILQILSDVLDSGLANWLTDAARYSCD